MTDLVDTVVSKILETIKARVEGGKCRVRTLLIKEFTETLNASFKRVLDKQKGSLTGFSFTECYISRLLDDHDFFIQFIATAATDLAERIVEGDNTGNIKYFTKVLEEGYWYVLHDLVSVRLGVSTADAMNVFFEEWPLMKASDDEYLRVKHSFIAVFVEQLMQAGSLQVSLAIENCLIEMRQNSKYATNMIGYVVNGKHPYKQLVRSIEAHVLYYNNRR